MMPDLDRYAATVLAAYGVTLALLAGLIFVSWRRAWRIKRELARMERPARERSDGPS